MLSIAWIIKNYHEQGNIIIITNLLLPLGHISNRKPMVVCVTNEHFEGIKKVLFKMGKKDGRAIMTKNWREVVEGARMKEDQMAIFRFMERSGGGLRVNMVSGMRIR